jgi:hypothetical protein
VNNKLNLVNKFLRLFIPTKILYCYIFSHLKQKSMRIYMESTRSKHQFNIKYNKLEAQSNLT